MNAEEAQRLRDRVHAIADKVQVHEGKLVEHGLLIQMLDKSVDALKDSMATSEQLDACTETLTLKLTHMHDTMEPIRKAVYGVMWLVLAAIVAAVLALVMKGPA